MRRNFDLSTGLVAIGALAVLVSLFLDWFEPGLTAWDVFEIADWLLVAAAVGALVVIGTESMAGSAPSPKLAWICGIVAFIVIAQLLDPPPAARDADREIGAWLALAGSVAMVAGAVLALMQISVTIDVAERERRRRTAAVDARDDEGSDPDAAGSGPSGRPASTGGRTSGLWQEPSAGRAPQGDRPVRPERSDDEKPTTVVPPAPPAGGVPTAADTPGDAPTPSEDPDRTQPLPRVDRPDAES